MRNVKNCILCVCVWWSKSYTMIVVYSAKFQESMTMYTCLAEDAIDLAFQEITGSGDFWRPPLEVGGSLCTGETRGTFQVN